MKSVPDGRKAAAHGGDIAMLSDSPLRDTFSLASDTFLLDVDGTILDIAPSPAEVRVPDSLLRTLTLLTDRTNGATALVSGRTIADLDRLFVPLVLSVIGCHGAEWRTAPTEPIVGRSEPLSEELKRGLFHVADFEPRIRVEDKRYTLAFHYRRAPDREATLQANLRRHLAPHDSRLHLLRGKSVLEVKSRGIDKGEAIGELMSIPPFAGRRPVFFGDDKTDQDAFAIVRDLGGVGISVGCRMPDAELIAPTPRAVRLWLARLAGSDRGRIE
ncbi:MAG TPA: trehalose-phosphatase [Rhizomicrobium sp.]|jgi:trehalose 6-phosphate phosphatase